MQNQLILTRNHLELQGSKNLEINIIEQCEEYICRRRVTMIVRGRLY
jgi:hypothetical protein